MFSGGTDNTGRMFDVTAGQATQVAQHEAPVKVVGWVDAQSGILATTTVYPYPATPLVLTHALPHVLVLL